MSQHDTKHLSVSSVDEVKRLVDRLVDHTQTLIVVLATLLSEDVGRQHWGKRKGCGSRHADHDSHNPTQLLEHDTSHSRNHCQRQEHRNDNQRSGDYRQPHLVGSVYRRLLRTRTALDMSSDILQHHDGIIHHHTDGYGERR